jgi:hypothetical protein
MRQIADDPPSLCLDRARRFTSVPAHTVNLSHHTEITLQVILKLKYALRLSVDNEEKDLQRITLWKAILVPCIGYRFVQRRNPVFTWCIYW